MNTTKQKKSVNKTPKNHAQIKNRCWVCLSANSRQLFLVTVLTIQHPDLLFNNAEPLPKGKKNKAWMQLFVNTSLFMMATVVHYPILVWDMPNTIQGKSDKAWNLYKGIINTDNATYFTPQPTAPTPTIVLGYLQDYDTAIGDVKTKTQTTAEREASWDILYLQGVKQYIIYAQQICDKHPDWAASIASVLGLRLKQPGIADVDDFRAESNRMGSVELIGKLKKQKFLFQWQGCKDPSSVIGWHELDIPPTFECKTTVEGLAEGKWYFRMRKIQTKGRVGEWSQTVSVMVKNS